MSKALKHLTQQEGYAYVDGGACAAQGFLANGLNCGLNSDASKNDLGMLYSTTECNVAAVYTSNKVKGAPILVCKDHLAKNGNHARAVIMNSKNANTANADGVEKAEKMCELAAGVLNLQPQEVLVASTGCIGQILPIEPIAEHVEELAKGLSPEGHAKAENAIMTTDTVPKELAVKFVAGGKECKLGGMAKGSGMIHPNMATTLNFITTDCAISVEMLQKALSDVVQVTYNCLSVDGDMSTNDTVLLMSSGLAGNAEITADGADYDAFRQALYIVMRNLTRMLAKDGEGATKLLECQLKGAPNRKDAITIAKSIIDSNLLKCAIFGEDANWGRIICAIGYADAEFDINLVDISIGSEKGVIPVCKNGAGVPFSEETAKVILGEDEICIYVDLHQGQAYAESYGCDLTYDYVQINGDYRS